MQANQNVETTVRVLIGTLPANVRTRLVRDLAMEITPAQTPTQTDSNRIMRRAEAGKVLGRSTRAIDLLAKQGHLKKVHFPGRTRAGGFLATDVFALIGR